MSAKPSWMSSSTTTGAQTPAAGAAAPATSAKNISCFGQFFVRTIHVVNILLCALLAWAGIEGLGVKGNPTEFFLGLYVLLFAVLLFTYEILRILPENSVNDKMKSNFGWLYGYIGLGSFLIFAGALNFGIREDISDQGKKVTLWTGIGTCSWGLVIILGYLARPEWFCEN
eukprot:44823_1